MRFGYLLFILSTLLISSHAKAFKIDTHVWIGQEIINDLETCSLPPFSHCISLSLDGKRLTFPVQTRVANSILANKSAYRIGHIGPDAFPDILAGQTIIHPGSPDASQWGTSHWLNFLLSRADDPEEIAFVYGFLGHAASDTFAHTYVNTYAGDIFNILDGETVVEARHFLIESKISDRLPAFVDKNGTLMATTPVQLIRKGNELAVPKEFVRDFLLKDPEVRDRVFHTRPIVMLQHEIDKM